MSKEAVRRNMTNNLNMKKVYVIMNPNILINYQI
jgi:hypothetical protein